MSETAIATQLSIRPLSPCLGAEILGLDVSRPLDAATSEAVRDIWHENLVVLFRGQSLDEDEQVAFAECFGPLNRSAVQRPHHSKKNSAVMFVSNIRENGELIGAHPDGEMHFHTDQCHQEKPCSATMLYAMEIPSQGGNTLFVNGYAAYESLAPEIKAKIDGRRAINGYDYSHAEKRGTVLREGIPHASHPIVRTHPATGRKALYVNRLMTLFIEDMPADQSEDLLLALFAHQEQKQFVYEHVWTPGDVIVWDNRCTLHARTDFSAAERRLLRRVTMMGEKPV
ncbi:MAG TPA: TauD/TfdA family dioxygenase [Beijerinckiaceae bacterium]|nr:TauD/TfdA family dioxygenase [Beijerinckiaceae bacterium]